MRGRPKNSVRVAIVSDTHGFLDPRIADVVASCEVAVHAGDIGGAAVLKKLLPRQLPVLAVRGNNDTPERWGKNEKKILARLPVETAVALPGGRLVVTHGDRVGPARRRHERLRKIYPDARAVVYGHSHHLVCDLSENPWILNPGAAGRSRTFGGPSCLLLVAGKKKWQVKQVRFKPLLVTSISSGSEFIRRADRVSRRFRRPPLLYPSR